MSQEQALVSYQVGIICALPLERTAVEHMLDSRHANIAAPDGDNAIYTFGNIGDHNVVIASLRAGAYGTVSAAGVAAGLRRTFPQIRYGLLVGIAGAMPRPNDLDGNIRLGDIVVGCVDGLPSIIDYQRGKDVRGGFDIRSELPQPPEKLLQAVTALQTQHARQGPTYLEHLAQVLKHHPRINDANVPQDYYNLPAMPDYLFGAGFDHVSEGYDCTECILQPGALVSRGIRVLARPPEGVQAKFIVQRRDGYADYPKVFYGTIASSNALMRSATRRNEVYERVKMQRKAKLLCFEMEASGVVQDFPCLVIRGICDYADSHKSDDWQNFAALTAASYAKDLLLRIPVPALSQSATRLSNLSAPLQTAVTETQSSHIPRRPPPRTSAEVEELGQQFIVAAGEGKLSTLQMLLQSGADVNFTIRGAVHPTALAAAVRMYQLFQGCARPLLGRLETEVIRERSDDFAEVIQWLYQQGADFHTLAPEERLIVRRIIE